MKQQYCYSLGAEIFQDSTSEGIIFDNDLQEGDVFYQGEAIYPLPSNFFCIDSLIEYMQENAYDNHSEFAEDYLQDLSDEKVKELETLISEWLDKNVNVSFYTVNNVKKLVVTKGML